MQKKKGYLILKILCLEKNCKGVKTVFKNLQCLILDYKNNVVVLTNMPKIENLSDFVKP